MEEFHVQTKFLSFVSPNLERFKQVNTFLWNCRCPYCGDSTKSRSKARGYFYRDKEAGLLRYQCHNCGKGASFKGFLKEFAQNLYNEYIFETFKSKGRGGDNSKPINEESVLPEKQWKKSLTPITSLSKTHLAVEYLKGRKIPKEKYDRFWYTFNFRDFLESIGIFMQVPDDPRVLLVETDVFGNLKIIIARALKKSDLRYVTILVDESYPKIFGLGKVDYTKPVRVVEGAIDSLFLDNCVAMLDSNLLSIKEKAPKLKDFVFIWDNEPRNIYNCRRIKKAIDLGESVVIFPRDIVEKDINQMIESGKDVEKIINTYSFKNIIAKLKFSKWSKFHV